MGWDTLDFAVWETAEEGSIFLASQAGILMNSPTERNFHVSKVEFR